MIEEDPQKEVSKVKMFGIFKDLYKDTLDVPSLHFCIQKLKK